MPPSIVTHPFAVDGNFVLRIDAEVANLGDVASAFHVGSVAARAKDTCDLGCRIHIV